MRQRGEAHRFRASSTVMESLRPYLRTSGRCVDDLDADHCHLDGYVTPGRFGWIRDTFPIVPDEAGRVTVRVSEFAAFVEGDSMPVAFVAADMACSDRPSDAERGLLDLDDLLREFNGDDRTWLTISEVSQAIAAELERGDELFALRLLATTVSDARSLTEPADIVRILQQPPPTGDRRWDVLIASVAARECRMWGIAAPEWTDTEGLEPWWFPGLVDESLVPLTVQRTPPELASKGIWLDERALTAV